MRTINRNIVSAVIVSKDNKIFLGKKDPDKGGVYIGLWHIPGGDKEEGESDQEALAREINEETGIAIDGYRVLLLDDKGAGQSQKTLPSGETVLVDMKFFVYAVHIDRDADQITVSLDDDLAQYQWVDAVELESLNLTPPSVELFKRINPKQILQSI